MVKNYYDFIDWIKMNGLLSMIAFDHDLDNNVQLPEWVILSANTVGAENIKCLLNNFKKHTNDID